MDKYETQYAKILAEKKKLLEQITDLENNDIVKKYLELCQQSRELDRQQKEIYRKMRIEQYSSCNHIWVNTLHDVNSWEGRSHNYHGCIKCGLDQRILNKKDKIFGFDLFTIEEKIMYDFMRENSWYDKENDTQELCDLELARAIYLKIKETHPDIDDETVKKYFVVALTDIRKIKVNDERKVSRTKRLHLNPKFNKWTANDVISY